MNYIPIEIITTISELLDTRSKLYFKSTNKYFLREILFLSLTDTNITISQEAIQQEKFKYLTKLTIMTKNNK